MMWTTMIELTHRAVEGLGRSATRFSGRRAAATITVLACALAQLLFLMPLVALAMTNATEDPPTEENATSPPTPHGDEALPDIFVSPPAMPTNVGIGLYVHSLNHVDPPSNPFPHFVVSILLTLRWTDPRLAFEGRGAGDTHVYQGDEAAGHLRHIWHPDIGFENHDGEDHVDGRRLVIGSDGNIEYEVVFTATFRAAVDLRKFPLDSQRFRIIAQSIGWNADEVRLEIIEEQTGYRARDSGQEDRASLEWTLVGFDHALSDAKTPASPMPHARATFHLNAKRSPGFYLWKLCVPLFLIVGFTWSTFWMTGEPAGTRLQRTFIALLSVVAYHQVVANHLPRIGYLTLMDTAVYTAFAFTAAVVLQIILTHRLERAGAPARAERLDRVSRWAFPLAFVVTVGWLLAYYALMS